MRIISMLGGGVHILGALVNRHLNRRWMGQIAQGQDMHGWILCLRSPCCRLMARCPSGVDVDRPLRAPEFRVRKYAHLDGWRMHGWMEGWLMTICSRRLLVTVPVLPHLNRTSPYLPRAPAVSASFFRSKRQPVRQPVLQKCPSPQIVVLPNLYPFSPSIISLLRATWLHRESPARIGQTIILISPIVHSLPTFPFWKTGCMYDRRRGRK